MRRFDLEALHRSAVRVLLSCSWVEYPEQPCRARALRLASRCAGAPCRTPQTNKQTEHLNAKSSARACAVIGLCHGRSAAFGARGLHWSTAPTDRRPPSLSGTHRCDCAQSVLKVMSSHDHVKYVGEPGPVQIDARSPGLGCVRVCSTYRSGEYDRCSARPVSASAGCTRRGRGLVQCECRAPIASAAHSSVPRGTRRRYCALPEGAWIRGQWSGRGGLSRRSALHVDVGLRIANKVGVQAQADAAHNRRTRAGPGAPGCFLSTLTSTE